MTYLFMLRKASGWRQALGLGAAALALIVAADSGVAVAQAQENAATRVKVVERIVEAGTVFHEIMDTPDNAIPKDLLEKARCLVIVPALKKAGFIVGAKYGVGVATCRAPAGAGHDGWTGPSTVRIEGGSVGFQIGAGEVDLVLMVMNEAGIDELAQSEFTIGGGASVMAGPVGRSASAETDAFMHAKILSYSRSRGVFAGVALEGATLRSDDTANAALYGKPVAHDAILRGQLPVPSDAEPLLETIATFARSET